jgi:hypothetical protein
LLSPACHCKAVLRILAPQVPAVDGVRGARPARPPRLVSGTSTSVVDGGFPVQGVRFGGLKSVRFGLKPGPAGDPSKSLCSMFNSSLLLERSCSGRDCLLLDLRRDSTGLQGQGQMNKTRAIYSTRSEATGELDGFFVALPFFSAAHRPQ